MLQWVEMFVGTVLLFTGSWGVGATVTEHALAA
jgi:hypothetical protein